MQPFDLQRIFFGDATPLFLLEIVFRTVVIYIYLLLVLRILGQRGMQPVSTFDFAIVIALGSAVGDPMFYPDIPLIHGMIVITIVVLLEWSLGHLTKRSELIEQVIEGKTKLIVKAGEVNVDFLQGANISSPEIFMMMREAGARQLGQVEVAYQEIDGRNSIFLFEAGSEKPGLPIMPPWDIEMPDVVHAGGAAPQSALYACMRCGTTASFEQGQRVPPCSRCESDRWTRAALPRGD